MTRTDSELLQAAQNGNRMAINELLERHQARVYRFGMRMCGAEEDAKDILQETLLAAARSVQGFRGASSVATWRYAIARSFCIKKHRTSKFAPQVESLDDANGRVMEVADGGRGPEDVVSGLQVQSALSSAIQSLDPMYREVLVLRDVEGLSAAEVGEVMGLTEEAVKSRLHRARLAVRERMSPLLGVQEPASRPAGSPCPDVVALFSKRLEGEISADVCQELEEHLRHCRRCASRCDSLRASLRLCRQAGDEVVPVRVERSVKSALRRFLESPP
ncbi:MAG TPA: sigma-70 family RNA polymerase sigma factor [Anaeromyxobacteraceae bacterium]|nr:sigma-70 family RNA polymerase sigma factor [Anaeromyxobacteraceae bacterium]